MFWWAGLNPTNASPGLERHSFLLTAELLERGDADKDILRIVEDLREDQLGELVTEGGKEEVWQVHACMVVPCSPCLLFEMEYHR